MAIDYTKYLKPIRSRFYSCVCCGKSLKEDDLVVDCADCGAICCEECVRSGEMNNHRCDDGDIEEEVD